jgi:hypothetical protein
MATIPATAQDIADRWRPLTDDEWNVADKLLWSAWALLRHKVPTLEDRLDADPVEVDDELVRTVLCEMVKRVLANPNLLRQEALQDYSSTFQVLAGQLTVTDEELDWLAAEDESTGGAFTIRPAYQVRVGSQTVTASQWEWRPS